ncbi:MAG: hypothetical protein HQK65_01980 [Desulfamplus sp.]|nr:hypothetical protein [Desulfamplus sp.]
MSKDKIHFITSIILIAISCCIGYSLGIYKSVQTPPSTHLNIPKTVNNQHQKTIASPHVISKVDLPHHEVTTDSKVGKPVQIVKDRALKEANNETFNQLSIQTQETLATGLLEKDLINKDIDIADAEIMSFLCTYGSEETLQAVKSMVAGRYLEPNVRVAAVSSINWDNHPTELLELLADEDTPSVKDAIITSAARTEMDSVQRAEFNEVVYNSLLNETDSGTITIILNYLSEKDPERLVDAYSFLTSQDVSQDVMDYLVAEAESFFFPEE